MAKADNDNVRLLVIEGTVHTNNLQSALLEMSLTSELTKSDKGLYHIQICPAYADRIEDKDWMRLADILAEETGFKGQKRAMVVHEKKSKPHLHVVFERYDHRTGKMLSDSFIRLAQDRARIRMEQELNLVRTPERNVKRPEMKEFLSKKWLECETIEQFLSITSQNGYQIASGTQRPYMVIDDTGRSFDLVRQLEEVRTKEVRERLKGVALIREKKAIQNVRQRKAQQEFEDTQQRAMERLRETKKNTTSISKTKMPANDNSLPKAKSYSMESSFTINADLATKNTVHLKKVLDKQQEAAKRKAEIIAKLHAAKIKRAQEFRDNELDMEVG